MVREGERGGRICPGECRKGKKGGGGAEEITEQRGEAGEGDERERKSERGYQNHQMRKALCSGVRCRSSGQTTRKR
eukprot:747524-Hanusia_phi.AAC.2